MTSVFALKKQNFKQFLEACNDCIFLEISSYEKESIEAMLQEYNDNPIVPDTRIAVDEDNDRLYATSTSGWADLTPEQLRELLKFFAELGTYADYWCDIFADQNLLTKEQIGEIFTAIEETYD